MGRFLQPDPIGFKGDASNLYRYCGNDWANKTDPMGLLGGTDYDQFREKRSVEYKNIITGSHIPASKQNVVAASQLAGLSTTRLLAAASAREGLMMAQMNATQKSGNDFEKTAHQSALKMLAEETHNPKVTQTGLITSGPPGRIGPVNEVIRPQNPFDLGGKRVAREEPLPVPKGQQAITVHYHHRTGSKDGPPSDVDLAGVKHGTMYFTNKESAKTGEYSIYRQGNLKPEIHHSDEIIP